jgi:acetyltransferase-like isoleucine patch superfamily enzyme
MDTAGDAETYELPSPGSNGPHLPSDIDIERSLTLRLEELVAAGVVEWGVHSYGAPHVVVYPGDRARLIVGRYCAFAMEVSILVGGEHRTDWVSTYPFRAVRGLPGALQDGVPASRGDIVIGDDVWVGRDATILSGTKIGHGAVVGARAMVVGDVRPYAIVAGNPAREIRRRFSDEVVDALLEIAWWEWPDELVNRVIPMLNSRDVSEFIAWARSQAGAAARPAGD